MTFLSSLHDLMGRTWFVMIMWQVCVIMNVSGATFCTMLTNINGKTLPFFQLACTYLTLLIVHFSNAPKTSMPWIKYIIVSCLNFGGDATAIYAYTMTSLSSAMILITTVIFWVAPISYFFLKRDISWQQVLSIFIGVAGIALVFVADGIGDSHWQGNVLALSSAFCYAMANILQEVLVYEASIPTFLFRFSLCTSPAAIIVTGAVEWKQIYTYNWSGKVIGLVIGYVVMLSLYYTLVPFVLNHSSATEMNISFLSNNFYSLGLSILFFGQKASWLYLVGFICIPIAIIIFCVWAPEQKYRNAGPQYEDNLNYDQSPKYIDEAFQ